MFVVWSVYCINVSPALKKKTLHELDWVASLVKDIPVFTLALLQLKLFVNPQLDTAKAFVPKI